MNDPTSTTMPTVASIEEKRARVIAAKRAKEAAAEERRLDAEIARLELAERLEKELGGPEGQQFAIHDATDVGEGLFAVKLGPAIVFRTYMDSQMTAVDRCDYVSACLAFPTKEEYLAARNRREGIDIELANRLSGLFGLHLKVNAGK